MAHGLIALGAKLGDKVAIIGSTRVEWTLSTLRCCLPVA
jgi:long-subunit acyl-CoA synthetase (AMP-forming)